MAFLAHRDKCLESYCHDPGIVLATDFKGKNLILALSFEPKGYDFDILHIG